METGNGKQRSPPELCMEDNNVFLFEKALKNYVLGVLLILTGLYLLSFMSFYFTAAMKWMKYFLLASTVLNGMAALVVHFIPLVYARKLAKPFLSVMLFLYYPMASWLLACGITATALWLTVIPLFIYAIFPDAKIIRWALWYCVLLLLVPGTGYALRYFLNDNAPVSFYSIELKHIVWPDILNIFCAFLFAIHSIIYINRFYRQKINYLEYLTGLKNGERDQSLLALNYSEQYKFGKIYEKIVTYLEDSHPYLDSDFKIGRMSNDLNINILYIEKAISLQTNMNFNNYINSFRIAHAKKLIQGTRQYTLEHIYLSSGFKTQTSFNRAFRTMEGVTPSDYRRQFGEPDNFII
jgi:AraC-like DNA-binding protein